MFNCLVSPFETSLWDPCQERSIWMSYLLFQGTRQVQSLHQWSVRISKGWSGKTLNNEASSVSSIAGKWKRINLVLPGPPETWNQTCCWPWLRTVGLVPNSDGLCCHSQSFLCLIGKVGTEQKGSWLCLLSHSCLCESGLYHPAHFPLSDLASAACCRPSRQDS